MKKGTRRADIKGRLTPRRLSWFGWFFGRVVHYSKILAVVAVVLGAVLWVSAQGYLFDAGRWVKARVAVSAASFGLRVSDITIEGRNRIDTQTIKDAVGIEPGSPILGIDIDAIHGKLTAISWVKDVQVRRALPDRLVITIRERLPVAIWTDGAGGPAVIDEEGVVLTHDDIASFGTLLAVEGKGCEKEAGSLIALLKGQPEIAVRVKKGIRVSERRWDILLENGLKIKLPEDDPGFALARAARAQLQEKVLDQDLKAIDLRQPDRIILEGEPGKTRDLLLKGGNPV
ncbi:MAG: FtsQ-type POTRA domain-containing protein [Proteobacteria bacterium]|nr:FtsQ-type POTRA domain-containing protein [Pseudomonadota bacterium]